jgi:UDP-N-acetylbacillosamine N-acetyltransferase
MSNKVILVGGFIEIIELCEDNNLEIVGLIDKIERQSFFSYPLLGQDDEVKEISLKFPNSSIIITPDNPSIRQKLFLHYRNYGFDFKTLISKNAIISKSVKIGFGSIIQTGVNVSASVNIGEFVKVNSCANIMHNAEIGNFTTIAPNAVILGYVTIGKHCYIGSNATILPHIQICDNVTIGAGAVVTKNILTPNSVYTGIPAKLVKK